MVLYVVELSIFKLVYKTYTFSDTPPSPSKSVHMNIFQMDNLPWKWKEKKGGVKNIESVWNQYFFSLTPLPLKSMFLYTWFNIGNYGLSLIQMCD